MKDKIFRLLLFFAAFIIILLSAGIIFALVSRSTEAFQEYGIIGFIANPEWDPRPATEEWGVVLYNRNNIHCIFGTSFCFPFSLAVALFNGEYFKGKDIIGC